jgi:pimeloyl-ACP methyl ester carboxylesterase
LIVPAMAHPLAITVLTIVLVLLMCRWPGKRAYLLLTINDWGFARDMVNRVNPEIELRFREFAETVADEIERSEDDEIIVAGHSFGAVWAVAALALALNSKPTLLKGKRVVFLALGSSLLKIALAPNAQFMRDWTKRILAVPNLVWHEIQTKDDLIAFYKADPFVTLGIDKFAATLKIDRVKYKEAMDAKRYRKMLASPYRTHRQYILYQDRRVAFDYILRLFGPLSGRDLALRPQVIESIGRNGALVAGN